MSVSTGLSQHLKNEARRLGFSMVGIVPAAPSINLAAYQQWLAAEMHGEMGYLARPDRQIRRENLNVILPDVKSLICVGLDYHTLRLPESVANDPARGRISNYAWGIDYHDWMTPRLKELAQILAAATGGVAQSKVYVDTGAILERDHAAMAGFGFTGKNTMLINPRRGSWFFLGELLSTVALEPDVMTKRMPGCGSCQRCLTACPTNAFPQPYVLDARRCISYLTIELRDWIPDEFRPLMGNWIYGCDICQDVCPFNRFAEESVEEIFRPVNLDYAAPHILDLLTISDAEFNERFRHSPIKRIKRERFIRNICIAAGNWGSVKAIEPLKNLLSDPSPLIRGHAVWALGRLASAKANDAIRQLALVETDANVQQEIKKAIQ